MKDGELRDKTMLSSIRPFIAGAKNMLNFLGVSSMVHLCQRLWSNKVTNVFFFAAVWRPCKEFREVKFEAGEN